MFVNIRSESLNNRPGYVKDTDYAVKPNCKQWLYHTVQLERTWMSKPKGLLQCWGENPVLSFNSLRGWSICPFYIFFNSISIISGQQNGEYEWPFARRNYLKGWKDLIFWFQPTTLSIQPHWHFPQLWKSNIVLTIIVLSGHEFLTSHNR